jgi:phage terminase small subunit
MRGGYRPGSGPQKGTKYGPRKPKTDGAGKKKRVKKPGKPPGIPADITQAAAAENMTPLAYMLKVMNDAEAAKERRDRMAVAAAPFIHPRKGEGQGKKDEKADRAKAAGSGKFAASKPPLKLVSKK